jgi:hypothetical protein
VASATAATVGFEGLGNGVIGPGGIYNEAGYRFTVTSGNTFGGGDANFSGNPGRPFLVGFFNPPKVDDTVSIVRTDGGLFTLDKLDFRRSGFPSSPSDAVRFDGRLSGSTIQLLRSYRAP